MINGTDAIKRTIVKTQHPKPAAEMNFRAGVIRDRIEEKYGKKLTNQTIYNRLQGNNSKYAKIIDAEIAIAAKQHIISLIRIGLETKIITESEIENEVKFGDTI